MGYQFFRGMVRWWVSVLLYAHLPHGESLKPCAKDILPRNKGRADGSHPAPLSCRDNC